jgi:hypothetical protein
MVTCPNRQHLHPPDENGPSQETNTQLQRTATLGAKTPSAYRRDQITHDTATKTKDPQPILNHKTPTTGRSQSSPYDTAFGMVHSVP